MLVRFGYEGMKTKLSIIIILFVVFSIITAFAILGNRLENISYDFIKRNFWIAIPIIGIGYIIFDKTQENLIGFFTNHWWYTWYLTVYFSITNVSRVYHNLLQDADKWGSSLWQRVLAHASILLRFGLEACGILFVRLRTFNKHWSNRRSCCLTLIFPPIQ